MESAAPFKSRGIGSLAFARPRRPSGCVFFTLFCAAVSTAWVRPNTAFDSRRMLAWTRP